RWRAASARTCAPRPSRRRSGSAPGPWRPCSPTRRRRGSPCPRGGAAARSLPAAPGPPPAPPGRAAAARAAGVAATRSAPPAPRPGRARPGVRAAPPARAAACGTTAPPAARRRARAASRAKRRSCPWARRRVRSWAPPPAQLGDPEQRAHEVLVGRHREQVEPGRAEVGDEGGLPLVGLRAQSLLEGRVVGVDEDDLTGLGVLD